MLVEIPFLAEGFLTLIALEIVFFNMDFHMVDKAASINQSFTTLITCILNLSNMSIFMMVERTLQPE